MEKSVLSVCKCFTVLYQQSLSVQLTAEISSSSVGRHQTNKYQKKIPFMQEDKILLQLRFVLNMQKKCFAASCYLNHDTHTEMYFELARKNVV